ncbi:hypothetical protein BU15DRAFT_48223 [Melanogaster broomeanus]|nr:hypothetical protein BU15DRAFT_48223 [Melanogaster broomeanus]
MDSSRYEAMDAQRFDHMRRKVSSCQQHLLPRDSILFSETPFQPRYSFMGQLVCKASQPELPPTEAVGGIWSDHELVLVPIDVTPPRDLVASTFSDSVSDSSSDSSSASLSSSQQSSSSSYFTTPSPIAENDLGSSFPASSRQVDTFDREDLIITRTIIRPAPQSPIMGLFTRPSSPIASRPRSPFSRPISPVLQALNCFSTTAFEQDLDNIQIERAKQPARQQVLQVIVTQTRQQYEQDMAFKELIQEVYPEAGRQRSVN